MIELVPPLGLATEFMSQVVAWPGKDEPGYVNLVWRTKDNKWKVQGFRDVLGFMKGVDEVMGLPDSLDIYYCLSTQSDPKKRSLKNALKIKSLWVDVDVKDSPKGYANLDDALDAIGKFISMTKLPLPSALIGSGGGCHVYWFGKDLTVDEWRPFANQLKTVVLHHGLRCDAGITTDAARILRVPGTFNHKTGIKRPVQFIPIIVHTHE